MGGPRSRRRRSPTSNQNSMDVHRSEAAGLLSAVAGVPRGVEREGPGRLGAKPLHADACVSMVLGGSGQRGTTHKPD